MIIQLSGFIKLEKRYIPCFFCAA